MGQVSSSFIKQDSSIPVVEKEYKSSPVLKTGEAKARVIFGEDENKANEQNLLISSLTFFTNKDSSIPVVEKEYKSSPVLKTGETKAGLIFSEYESNANEQNLLISSLTFFTNKDSSIPVVEKEYKSSPVLKTGEAKAGLIFGEDERKANEQNLLISLLTFVTNKDSSIVNKEYKSSPVLKTGEAKSGLVFGEGESKANEQNLLISSLTFGSCNDSHKKPRRRKVKICKEKMVVVKERCIKQYCSSHKILLVGEEDFSFSASLAMAFGSASNMIATSLDSEGLLRKNYMHAMSNIQELKKRGCLVMHGVDVTQMADYYFLQGLRFDRIIYNFPLAGFFKDESRKSQLNRRIRKLVRLFFMNAKKMISEKGEIHIAHKSRGFFLEKNLKSLAGTVGLRLIKELPFNYKDFEGYCTKYGLRSSTESSSQVEVPEFDTGRTEKEVIKEVKVCKEVVVVKEKWIKQYCSSHKILLVGEGDFSFSASLAVAFGSASNMIATSLDSEGVLRKNYKHAMSNIQELKKRGCLVMHGVDVTQMADYYFLQGMRFDRIIYNFPLASFFKDESRKSQHKRNRKLVRLFFMNTKKMISEKGEIHIAHKSRGFFLEGNLKSLAGSVGLRLIKELPFNYKDFEGYCTKYGLRSSTESSSQVEVPEFDTGRTEKEVIKEVKVCKEVVVVKEKWIKQYCSSHKILLVGEGDFSFSASLAVAFGSASNMIATSLDSEGFLRKNYKRAMSNIHELKKRGCFVMHEVDATEMAGHYSLRGMRFDRIIYNFPHAGFFKESRKSQLKRNRKLVHLFFMNAKKMISKKGEVHIAHKSCGFFLEWNLKSLAGNVGLRLINELSFNVKDFSGYCTKYGFGGDNNFDCNPSKRYIFGL